MARIAKVVITKDQLQEDNMNGMSIKEITEKYGVGEKTIRELFHRYGMRTLRDTRKEQGPKVTKEAFDEVYKEGMDVLDMANFFDVSPTTINTYLVKYGYKERKKRKIIKFDDELIYELLKSGTQKKEIAEQMGISVHTLRQHISSKNLDPNKRHRENRTFDEEGSAVDPLLKNVEYAAPKPKPFKTVIQGQKFVDVSCLYGL